MLKRISDFNHSRLLLLYESTSLRGKDTENSDSHTTVSAFHSHESRYPFRRRQKYRDMRERHPPATCIAV